MSALILVFGSAAGKLASHGFVHRLRAMHSEADLESMRNTPQDLLPENLRPFAGWITDLVTAGTTFVGPIAAILLGIFSDKGSVFATVAVIAAFVLSFILLVYVATYDDVAAWSQKSRLDGWVSPVLLLGLGANVASMLLVALFYYFGTAQSPPG